MRTLFRKLMPSVAAMALLLMMVSAPVFGQQRIMKGRVTNEKGEAIADVQVLILGTDVKREYKVKTDKKGEYFYMGIPFGTYKIIVRGQGYLADCADGLKPSIAQELDTNFSLKAGDAAMKTACELTPEEMAKARQENEKSKQKAASNEVKTAFDAGLALAQQGKYAEAVDEYRKALAKDAEQPYVIANMADALSRMNKNDEALDLFQKAIVLKPDDAAMYTNMGVLLGRMGKTAESQEAFKKAAEINPAQAGQNFYNLGATLVNSGRTADAAAAFKQSIAADPNFAEAYYQLGICLSGSAATIPDAINALKKYSEIGKNTEQVEVAKQLITALTPQEKPAEKDTGKKKKP